MAKNIQFFFCFFLVDNTRNEFRRSKSSKCEFREDFGACDSGSSKNYWYVKTDNRFCGASLKDRWYCRESRVQIEGGKEKNSHLFHFNHNLTKKMLLQRVGTIVI